MTKLEKMDDKVKGFVAEPSINLKEVKIYAEDVAIVQDGLKSSLQRFHRGQDKLDGMLAWAQERLNQSSSQ